MFFNIPTEQKNSYKANIFPANVTLNGNINTVGSDKILKLKLSFNDGENFKYKVYKNIKSQDFLKIKVFAITNFAAAEEILNPNNINSVKNIENIINKYSLPNKSLNAVTDHKFIDLNKKRITALLNQRRSNYFGTLKIDYENIELIIPQQNINFLSIGYYFYNDMEEYLKNNNLDEKFIDESMTWDKLYIKNVILNNIFQRNSDIKDLRKIKSILQDNNFLENLNSSIDIESTLNKKLQKSFKSKQVNGFFSKIYFARTKEKNLGMIFHYDINNIITKNSAYTNIVSKSSKEIFDLYTSVIKVDTVKVLRRQLLSKNNNTKSFKILYDTEKAIVQTSLNNTYSLIEVNNNDVNLSEINTNLFGNSIKTISIEDKSIFNSTPGLYQYGLSLTVKDDLGFMFKYLSEEYLDNNIKNLKTFSSILQDPKYYDPLDVSVTPEFIDYIDKNQLLINSVAYSLKSFINILKIFGIDKNLDSNLEQTINNIFDIKYIDLEQVLYFISIFEKIQNQINKLSKINYETSYTIEHWFDDTYDNKQSINVGFKFFDSSTINGLSLINSEQYIQKIRNEIDIYASEPSELNDSTDPYLYSYITPISLNLPNETMYNINDILSSNDINIFSQIALELKKSSIFNNKQDNNTYIKSEVNETAEEKLKNAIGYSGELISNNLSISSNLIKKPISLKRTRLTTQLPEKDFNVDTSTLMLQILSHYNITTNSFIKINKINNGVLTLPRIPNDLPLHLKLLLENRSKITSQDKKYLQDIKEFYKFSLMFNTIHKVEYLMYENNLNNEKWYTLDNTVFQKVAGNTNLICRLKSYTDEKLKIKGIKEFNIPIYDEYFLLNINNINTDIDFPIPVIAEPAVETETAVEVQTEASGLLDSVPPQQPAVQQTPPLQPTPTPLQQQPQFLVPQQYNRTILEEAVKTLNTTLSNTNSNIVGNFFNNVNNLVEQQRIQKQKEDSEEQERMSLQKEKEEREARLRSELSLGSASRMNNRR